MNMILLTNQWKLTFKQLIKMIRQLLSLIMLNLIRSLKIQNGVRNIKNIKSCQYSEPLYIRSQSSGSF